MSSPLYMTTSRWKQYPIPVTKQLPHLCKRSPGFSYSCRVVRKDGDWFPVETEWTPSACASQYGPRLRCKRSISGSLSNCSTSVGSFDTKVVALESGVSGTPMILMLHLLILPLISSHFIFSSANSVFISLTVFCRVATSSDQADRLCWRIQYTYISSDWLPSWHHCGAVSISD